MGMSWYALGHDGIPLMAPHWVHVEHDGLLFRRSFEPFRVIACAIPAMRPEIPPQV